MKGLVCSVRGARWAIVLTWSATLSLCMGRLALTSVLKLEGPSRGLADTTGRGSLRACEMLTSVF